MEILLPFGAFALVLAAATRSLGWGFLAVYGVGYINQVVRANYLGVYSTFMFDAAVLAFYGAFFGRSPRSEGVWSGPGVGYVLFLMAWPVLLSAVPVNHFLVQLVALRSSVWMLPMLLAAMRLTASDLVVLTRGLAALNLLSLVVGVYIFQNGVEAVYPENAVTRSIYNSKDIAGSKFRRVPSTFINAHAYGGTMLLSLPFLLDRAIGTRVSVRDRCLAGGGLIAAGGGLLMCGARLPLIMLAVALLIAWAVSRFSLKLGLAGAALIGIGVVVAGTSDRFQRARSLEDTDVIANRIAGSANDNFWVLMLDYPLGAGMGSAVGTSIPFFLADVAPEPIGLENEYSRLLVDQGWPALGGWLAFVVWLFRRPPAAGPPAPWRIALVLMYAICLSSWLTAFIGSGLLSSIPGTAMLLTQMGILIGTRRVGGSTRGWT